MLNEKALAIKEKKAKGEKIACLTAYDALTAQILDEAGIDIILVGDSVGNVILGYEDTIPVTIEDMVHHTSAVRRRTKNALLVADVPYIPQNNAEAALIEYSQKLVQDAGADAVKIEGVKYLQAIKKLIKNGIPVMGHIGFTPQTGEPPKVKGKIGKEADQLLSDAKALEEAGVFSIVLELVDDEMSKKISMFLKIPTIGIGSGSYCDGQVLVTHDMVGLTQGKVPKFVKKYADLAKDFKKAVEQFIGQVKGV